MEGADFLLTVSELSLALVTFTALVLVLRQVVGGRLQPIHVLIVRMFAACGITGVFLSLLPFILEFMGLGADLIWRVSSGTLAVTGSSLSIWYFMRRRQVAPDRPHNAGSLLSFVASLYFPIVLPMHASGLIYKDSIGPFSIGLVVIFVPVTAAFFASVEDFISSSE